MLKWLHHAYNSKFARAIVKHVTKAEETRASHNTHNVAMISAKHGGQEFFEHPIASEQIHAHNRNEFVFFTFHEWFKRVDASVVYLKISNTFNLNRS